MFVCLFFLNEPLSNLAFKIKAFISITKSRSAHFRNFKAQVRKKRTERKLTHNATTENGINMWYIHYPFFLGIYECFTFSFSKIGIILYHSYETFFDSFIMWLGCFCWPWLFNSCLWPRSTLTYGPPVLSTTHCSWWSPLATCGYFNLNKFK